VSIVKYGEGAKWKTWNRVGAGCCSSVCGGAYNTTPCPVYGGCCFIGSFKFRVDRPTNQLFIVEHTTTDSLPSSVSSIHNFTKYLPYATRIVASNSSSSCRTTQSANKYECYIRLIIETTNAAHAHLNAIQQKFTSSLRVAETHSSVKNDSLNLASAREWGPNERQKVPTNFAISRNPRDVTPN